MRRSEIAATINGASRGVCFAALVVAMSPCANAAGPVVPVRTDVAQAQVPTWSNDDLNFFLHGSMGTEVVPESVLEAFSFTYPDLFSQAGPGFGLIYDGDFRGPIGFSRKQVSHLGNLSAVGINCASCHYAEVEFPSKREAVRVLGVASHFDVEAFFGSVLVATVKTSDPKNMKRFLTKYYSGSNGLYLPDETTFESVWNKQQEKILAAMNADPLGANGIAPGDLHKIDPSDVRIDKVSVDKGTIDLAAKAQSMLKLFHNMRAALHVPDKPPEKAPPASGPGRNDAFGLLAASLLNMPQPYSPIKFGLVWNVDKRTWVHWDGNTKSPLARNLLASLGLGAPMHGKHGDLEFAMVKRQTDLSEKIRPPRYPFEIDRTAASRGEPLFKANCDSCHGGPETDKRLYSVAEVGTDPHRAEMFTQKLADGFNKFLAELETEGYQPPKEFEVRSTGKYWAPTLSGVWARTPYLHNGSVRTMQELLARPGERPKSFHRGSRVYDDRALGYIDEGAYVFETTASGNSNSGHDYGTGLAPQEKADLIEYLKTL